ncbi:MAG: zinc-binding dehydrogenase [Halioglobus sp.]|nr:zinc-binding dehydrogenase [Halioglobus sp.]
MSYIHVDVEHFGGPDQLRVMEEAHLSEPAPGQVRVRVLTAGTGFTDTIIRQGHYIDVKEKPPFTLGYDWFGVVDKLGAGVDTLEVGQLVADMSVIGGYTQYLCVAADRVIPAPANLDPAAAVAMILSYTTAYQMLTRLRQIPAGSTCLVHAAGGAVGTALLELGRLMGLTMYGTASAGKHEIVRRYGGIPIDYRTQDFVTEIRKATNGKGVDVVFDTIGGKHWSRSYRCVKKGGILVCFGVLEYTTGKASTASVLVAMFKLNHLWKLIPDGKSATFYNISHRRDSHPEEFKADVSALFVMLSQGKLQPAVAEVVPLRQAAEVHRRIDAAEIAGKVVLRCTPE